MAEVDVQISGSHYLPYKEQLVFTRTATLSAGETAEAYWDGIPSKEWFPTVDSVYSGQLNCLVSVTDAGSGTQAVGASNVDEINIIFTLHNMSQEGDAKLFEIMKSQMGIDPSKCDPVTLDLMR